MPTLHQAIIRRNQQQVRLLANVGCNVNKLDSRMCTPLRLVCDLDNEFLRVSLGRILLRHGAGVEHKDEFGISVFSYCCMKQCIKLVSVMIEEREIPWLDKDCNGNTALHHASASGNLGITRMILEQMRKYGLDIDQRNDLGETPLISAERMGHIRCAQLLRECGKASTAARDNHVLKNADEWRRTRTTRASQKLSPYFSAKFPEVAKQLTITVHIKRSAAFQARMSAQDKLDKPHKLLDRTGTLVTKDALPTLLKLQKEQQMDTFRPSAKLPPCKVQNTEEFRDSSGDDRSQSRADQIAPRLKRKAFSYAGLPVLAQQRFAARIKKHSAQRITVSKTVNEEQHAPK